MTKMNASFLKILILCQMKELEIFEDFFVFAEITILKFSLNQIREHFSYKMSFNEPLYLKPTLVVEGSF